MNDDRSARVRALSDRMRSAGLDPAVLDGLAPPRLDALASGVVVRDGLCRSVPFEQSRATEDEPNDGLTIEGYGAVFGAVTHIRGWEGDFEEEIAPGAFRKSLRDKTPIMQFDHGHHPLLGGLPLGRWNEAREDDHGLYVKGRVFDNWLTTPFRDAIAEQAVDGMSFRFSVVREEWRDNDGKVIKDDKELFELIYYGAGDRGPIRRTLKEVKTPEVGPVVWPAYKETSVGVRSGDPDSAAGQVITIDLGRVREPAYRRRLAEITCALDSAVRDAMRNTGTVDTAPGDEHGTDDTRTEPHATVDTAADHSADSAPERDTAAPDDTASSTAGEHSPRPDQPARPVSPEGRSRVIKAEYRKILDRTLAASKSTIDE